MMILRSTVKKMRTITLNLVKEQQINQTRNPRVKELNSPQAINKKEI
jgi:hypothetical protein